MQVAFIKTPIGFVPADTSTEEFTKKIKLGEVIRSDFKRMRNYKFHKKLFALLNLAFEYWQPGEITSHYGIPEKNFDRFRKDLIILAGYYHAEIRLDGSVRVTANSISFSWMDEDTFGKLYNNVLTVIMKTIPILDRMSKEEINDLTDRFLDFA